MRFPPWEGTATLAARVGIGHDTHRLIPGGPLRLGGVDVPFDFRLDGHSDADVLLHALVDALLGAAALGDIGEIYPDSDPANRGLDSGVMLRGALERVVAADFRVVNVDCIVFAERPKLSPFKDELRQSLARLLEIGADRVNVKAKTGERVGPVGRGEAISAECVVLLERV